MTKRPLGEIHGTENCHICGKPRAEASEELSICSYPHGMVPDKPIGDSGMWSWKDPDIANGESTNKGEK